MVQAMHRIVTVLSVSDHSDFDFVSSPHVLQYMFGFVCSFCLRCRFAYDITSFHTYSEQFDGCAL